ncbi:MAG: hypothetical protein E6Z74_09835 [Clostridium perfringens]|uniref:hypothetical protein n=1 Tax=Clostridium butyricum TaxID=1492 RepID=UPI000A6AF337|nr:hypothetical protein [Clostridium butyricum]MDU5720786.1 hypothetical protein [Clostridium butyricum]MDU5776212.1 hypothetical protein [Clostridium perfringens]
MLKVICDNPNCKHEFEPQIKEKYLGAMISETYLECPHCGTKYLIKLDNTFTRKLQRNIENIKEILKGELPAVMEKAFNVALKHNVSFHKQAMSILMRGKRCDVKNKP